MAVEARETLVEEDGAGAAHQRDADARTPPLTAREAAAAGGGGADPRVGDGSRKMGEEEVDQSGAVGVGDTAEAEGGGERIASRGVSSSGSTLLRHDRTKPRGSNPPPRPVTS